MGGNIFDRTSPVEKSQIKPTVKGYVEEINRLFPKLELTVDKLEYTGSTGKADISNDIDLILDEQELSNLKKWNLNFTELRERQFLYERRARTASRPEILMRAKLTLIAEDINQRSRIIRVKADKIYKQTLFFRVAIHDENGKMTGESVQLDFNIGNPDWLKFSHYSKKYKNSKVKGLHRTQLLLSLFKEGEYKFIHHLGIKDEDTNKVISKDPKESIELLNTELGISLTKTIYNDYYRLKKYIEDNLAYELRESVFNRYLKILDCTRVDIPDNLVQEWTKKKNELKLKGKYLPKDSILKN